MGSRITTSLNRVISSPQIPDRNFTIGMVSILRNKLSSVCTIERGCRYLMSLRELHQVAFADCPVCRFFFFAKTARLSSIFEMVIEWVRRTRKFLSNRRLREMISLASLKQNIEHGKSEDPLIFILIDVEKSPFY